MLGKRDFLKVSPMKDVMSFEEKRKLSLRFNGPFEIFQKLGDVAYRLLYKLFIYITCIHIEVILSKYFSCDLVAFSCIIS